MSAKERVRYIDFARGIAVLLVIAGHAVPVDSAAKRLIYSFHMPLFFMISGLTKNGRETASFSGSAFRNRLRVRAERILIPFFAWAFVYAPLSVRSLLGILYGSRETLVKAESLSSLWYLPVLFLADTAAELILPLCGKRKRAGLLTAAAAALMAAAGFLLPHHGRYGDPWGVDIAFMASSFILAGAAAAPLFKRISLPVSGILAAGCTALYAGAFLLSGAPEKKHALMAEAAYRDPLRFLILAFSGSLMMIMLSLFLSSLSGKCRPVLWAGRNTMGIFILHKPFLSIGGQMLKAAGLPQKGPVPVLASCVFALAGSALLTAVITRYVPQLFGKKRCIYE